MSIKKLSAGGHIEAHCTKCRKITNHTIVAMANDVPVKVECNTCKGQHKYRLPAVPKTATPRRTTAPKATGAKEWEKIRPSLEGKQTIAYSMTTAFKVGNVMKHPVFGLGIVQNSLGPGKIEVLFESGSKKLSCLS